jgi:NADH-quinone oxidoreductase subunit N
MTLELATAGLMVCLLVADIIMRGRRKILLQILPFLLAGLLGLAVFFRPEGAWAAGVFAADGLAWFSKIIILSGAVLTALLSVDSLRIPEKNFGAYAALILVALIGMLFLVSSRELITAYISLETMTLCLVGLTAIDRKDDFSLEAGMKYLVISVISSGILLYGLSLVYASTASTSFDAIRNAIALHGASGLLLTGVLMVLVGIAFKLSVVPVHVWTPDVYQGAPTPVTAFLSVASKTAGFILAIRIFMDVFRDLYSFWAPVVAVISFLTMTVGNLMAIPQKNMKRLLAFSTISQAGYILFGLLTVPELGVSSILFFLLAYTFTNLAAFTAVAIFANKTGSENIEDYAGLARKEPLLALTLLFSLLSLAGIPPLAGFFGKYYLFFALMKKGYLWLVILGAMNSTVSLYYYLLVLKQAYIFDRKKDYPKITLSWAMRAVLAISLAGIILLGIFPAPIIEITSRIASLFP